MSPNEGYKKKSILSNIFDVFKFAFLGVYYWIVGNIKLKIEKRKICKK